MRVDVVVLAPLNTYEFLPSSVGTATHTHTHVILLVYGFFRVDLQSPHLDRLTEFFTISHSGSAVARGPWRTSISLIKRALAPPQDAYWVSDVPLGQAFFFALDRDDRKSLNMTQLNKWK